MRASPIPFIGGFYADESRPWSQQDIVNWLPAASESQGTRSLVMAKTPPGLSPFARIAADPVRGVYNAEGRLFTVMGNTLYLVSPTEASAIGTVPGVSRVKMAHNQITGGNELLVVKGSAGFLYNTVTEAFTVITDDGYPGAMDALFMDGYFVQIEPARRFAFNSDLADGLSYNTLDRFTSEKSPDLLVALGSTQNDLILFSETTAEFFENTGAAQQPFRSKRISMERGCASRYGVVHLDNTVFWLGNDGKFYILDGYGARRISTRPIEQAILGLNWAQAFGFVWESAGHAVAYWTFPDGQTWGYDVSQPPGFQWHRRESYGFDRWRVTGTAFWRNRWIAGDFQRGRLWDLDWDYPLEYDTEMVSELTGPVIHDHQNAVKMPRLELVFDTGQPEVAVRDFEIDAAPVAITGDVPDGFIGEPMAGAYTVAGGMVPYGPITVLSGTFPAGLTLHPDGTWDGTPTTLDDYTWTVGGVDADGTPFSIADSATVRAGVWWVTNFGTIALDDDLYISQDPLSFGAATTRTPNITPGYGPKGVAVDVVLVANNSGTGNIERITDMTGPVTTTLQGPFPAVRHLRVIDGTVFQIPLAGTTYLYSTDNGANWLPGTVPGSPDMADIARLDNGRWLTLVSGLSGGFYYSDEDLPTEAGDWISAGASNPGGGGHADGYIAVNGNTAVSFGSTNVKRTTDGETWGAVTGPGNVDTRDGLAVNDVFVCQAGQNGGVHRSIDDGQTWTTVVFTSPAEVVQRIETGGGALVACTHSGQMWVSLDNGENWDESTTPGANGKRAAFVRSTA